MKNPLLRSIAVGISTFAIALTLPIALAATRGHFSSQSALVGTVHFCPPYANTIEELTSLRFEVELMTVYNPERVAEYCAVGRTFRAPEKRCLGLLFDGEGWLQSPTWRDLAERFRLPAEEEVAWHLLRQAQSQRGSPIIVECTREGFYPATSHDTPKSQAHQMPAPVQTDIAADLARISYPANEYYAGGSRPYVFSHRELSSFGDRSLGVAECLRSDRIGMLYERERGDQIVFLAAMAGSGAFMVFWIVRWRRGVKGLIGGAHRATHESLRALDDTMSNPKK